jgi:hypothetical protein
MMPHSTSQDAYVEMQEAWQKACRRFLGNTEQVSQHERR